MIIGSEYQLSDEQRKIMDLVYQFRFINRQQVQKIFGHKVPRRVNPWLKDLFEHKYLKRIYSRKLLENTKPAIYFLDNGGISWVRINYFEDEPEKVKRFYQDKKASQRFINHCLKLCDLYIQSIPTIKKTEYDQFSFSTFTELWYQEELRSIRPDAHLEHFIDDEIESSFLELIEDYVPMYALRYKIDQYIEFRSNPDKWVEFWGSDFETLVVQLILPNNQKLNRVRKYIRKRIAQSYNVENIIFKLTTYQKIVTQGIKSDIWIEIKDET